MPRDRRPITNRSAALRVERLRLASGSTRNRNGAVRRMRVRGPCRSPRTPLHDCSALRTSGDGSGRKERCSTCATGSTKTTERPGHRSGAGRRPAREPSSGIASGMWVPSKAPRSRRWRTTGSGIRQGEEVFVNYRRPLGMRRHAAFAVALLACCIAASTFAVAANAAAVAVNGSCPRVGATTKLGTRSLACTKVDRRGDAG